MLPAKRSLPPLSDKFDPADQGCIEGCMLSSTSGGKVWIMLVPRVVSVRLLTTCTRRALTFGAMTASIAITDVSTPPASAEKRDASIPGSCMPMPTPILDAVAATAARCVPARRKTAAMPPAASANRHQQQQNHTKQRRRRFLFVTLGCSSMCSLAAALPSSSFVPPSMALAPLRSAPSSPRRARRPITSPSASAEAAIDEVERSTSNGFGSGAKSCGETSNCKGSSAVACGDCPRGSMLVLAMPRASGGSGIAEAALLSRAPRRNVGSGENEVRSFPSWSAASKELVGAGDNSTRGGSKWSPRGTIDAGAGDAPEWAGLALTGTARIVSRPPLPRGGGGSGSSSTLESMWGRGDPRKPVATSSTSDRLESLKIYASSPINSRQLK